MNYFVYILRCADGTLYTGITTDIKRRISEHNDPTQNKGAKYTKYRSPVELVYQEEHPNRSEATRREMQIKKMSRSEKTQLFSQ